VQQPNLVFARSEATKQSSFSSRDRIDPVFTTERQQCEKETEVVILPNQKKQKPKGKNMTTKKLLVFIILIMTVATMFAEIKTLINDNFSNGWQGWTPVHLSGSNDNRWFWQENHPVNPLPPGSPTSKPLYIGTSSSNNNYNNATVQRINHVHKLVNIPAGATNIQLSFDFKGRGSTNEPPHSEVARMLLFVSPGNITPTAATNTALPFNPASNNVVQTELGRLAPHRLGTTFINSTVFNRRTITIPNSYAGSQRRIIFTWHSTGGNHNPAAAISNVRISYVGPPDPAQYPVPGNGTNPTIIPTTLSWSPSTLGVLPTGYNVFVWTNDQGGHGSQTTPLNAGGNTNIAMPSWVTHSMRVNWSVVPRNSYGSTVNNIATWTFTTNQRPLATINMSPHQGSTVDVDTHLSWGIVPDSPTPANFKVFWGDSEPLSQTTTILDANARTWTPSFSLAPSTPYFWRIVPNNLVGDALNNITMSFTTNPVPSGTSSPTPTHQVTGLQPTGINLSWSAPTVHSRNLRYEVYFDNVNPPTTLLAVTIQPWLDIDEFLTETLAFATTYYWQVVPSDVNGTATDCPVWSFTIRPPEQTGDVIAEYPTPGSMVWNLEQAFEWRVVVDGTVSPPVGYNIYIGESNPPPLVVSNHLTTTWSPTVSLDWDRNYFWAAEPISHEGGVPDVLQVWPFSTALPPPGKAQLISPTDEATNRATNLTFIWAPAVADFERENDILYRFFIGTDPLEMDEFDLGQQTSFPYSLAHETEYHWSVVAYTQAGDAVDSDVWTFTTIVAPPLPAVNPSPSNNAINLPVEQTFTWEASDSGNTPTGYRLWLGATIETMQVVHEGTETTWTPEWTLDHGTMYLWRVVPTGVGGETMNTPLWNFTTIPPRPAPVITPSPSDQATGVSINPTLTWTPATFGGTATGYKVFFGTTPYDKALIHMGAANSATIPMTLMQNTTYYWEVVPFNFTGDAEGTPVWSFTTIDPSTSDIDDAMSLAQFQLLANYPNPFNPETTISFVLPTDAHVDIHIYNMKGQAVRTLTSSRFTTGQHHIVWNGKDDLGSEVTSGVYLYRMAADGHSVVRKMVLMK
jgi:hypothetical protein